MAYSKVKGPKQNIPFAHAFDAASGVQVPMVQVIADPDSVGVAGADREFLIVDYQVKTAFTGADVGDFVRSVEVWDIGSTSSTQVGSTSWRNLSKGTTLASAPNINNISVAGSSTTGLTNAQLRAAPLPLMEGAATSVLQQAISDAIATMSGKVATQSGLASIFDQIGATNTGIGALNTKLATEVTLSTVATVLGIIRDRTPTLGAKDVAGSTSVTLATNDPGIGTKIDSAAALGAGGTGIIGWLSTIAFRMIAGVKTSASSMSVTLASDDAQIGTAVTAAGALGTGGTGLMGWISNISLRLPLATKTSAGSLSVTIASDDAQIGTKVTAIPALATGGTGLIGWLSAQWQALINLGNQLPATIGRKASSASMSVVLASDDAQIGTPQTASAALSTGGAGILGWLSSIRDTLLGLLTVNTLAQPLVARKIAVNASSGSSTPLALTTTCRRASIVAVGTSMRYVVGTGDPALVIANATRHLIMAGERLDIGVPAGAVIAAVSDTSAAGTLEITELG